MPVVQQGAINNTALIVPDLYVQIVPPQVAILNGVPTNILGIVGTAAWGPANSPVVCGNMADYANNFGAVLNRAHDLGTAMATAILQGASNFRCVRVTDGTDATATAVIGGGGSGAPVDVTFSSLYTGTLANADTVALAKGTQPSTWKVTVSRPGWLSEVFDNIGGTGNAFWVNVANAINNGTGPLRGKSQLVSAVAGSGTDAASAESVTLSGGTDGVASITSSVMIGVDTAGARTGMYALRNTKASVAFLSDLTDTTTFTTQVAFGLSEGIYMVGVTAAGDTIGDGTTTGAVYVKNQAGIDSYAFKYLFGDWVWWNDSVNGLTRLVSPQGFVAGKLAALSPEQSSLNKPLYGIVATQESAANCVYSGAELQMLIGAGIDLITNPVPGGNYFGARAGHNSSSNILANGDNYTRLTNYIAFTLNAGMGLFVGQLQTVTERQSALGAIALFLQNMQDQGMIGDVNAADQSAPAYSVQLNATNNPTDRVAQGYQQADVKVRYFSVVEKFLINFEGSGATVINPAV